MVRLASNHERRTEHRRHRRPDRRPRARGSADRADVGQALTATELAAVAGVTKQTISAPPRQAARRAACSRSRPGPAPLLPAGRPRCRALLETLMGVAFRTGALRLRVQPARTGAAQGARLLRPSGRRTRRRVFERLARPARSRADARRPSRSPPPGAACSPASASTSRRWPARGARSAAPASTGASADITWPARSAPRCWRAYSSSVGPAARRIRA